MKLYPGKVTPIAKELLATLTKQQAIEVEDAAEVETDFEAVLKEYLRLDRDVTNEARSVLERRGLGYQQLPRVRSEVAKRRHAPEPDDILPYLVQQLINILFHSRFVEEVFAEDDRIRTLMVPVLRRHLDVEEELDAAIRGKMKNLNEGTPEFEIEYQRISGTVKRSLGLL